jgi:xanthine dehydrogenase accessory factor
MMGGWLKALGDLERDGEPSVLVTVVTARGSTPREAGCKMVVTREAQYDTIGGGNLEFTCVDAARKLLDGAETPVLRDFPLGPELGQCCGGHVSVLFEPLRPILSHVAVFGAGHVGRALVTLLGGLRLRVNWIDTRADALAGAPFGVIARHTSDPAREVASLPAGAILLVMTHDHQVDFDIVAAALPRADFAAVGLIGSETKRVRFVRRLARVGVAPEAIDRLICPIGVPGAGGKLPAEIAISVAAQILQIQQRMKDARPLPAPARVRLVHPPAADCGDCGAECSRDAIPRAINA